MLIAICVGFVCKYIVAFVGVDGAAVEKNRIEELQRTARRDRKKRSEEFLPR